jgi:hypothetical protein
MSLQKNSLYQGLSSGVIMGVHYERATNHLEITQPEPFLSQSSGSRRLVFTFSVEDKDPGLWCGFAMFLMISMKGQRQDGAVM